MNKQLRILMICLVLGFGAIPSMAQQVLTLSLEQARAYAREHNRNLIHAGLAVDESQARLREVIAQGLPQVNATVDYQNFFGSTATLGAMPGFEIEFNPTSNLSVNLGQLIFSGSYIVGIQTARLFRELSETNREKTEQEIMAQVSQSYYLALIAEKSKDLVASNLTNMHELMQKTKAMVQVGVAQEIDYDQLNVQASMLADGLRAAERQSELAMNMLRLQLGLSAETEIRLSGHAEELLQQNVLENKLSEHFDLSRNLDFQLIQMQTALAEKQINMERSAYLPTLSGFYNYTEKLLQAEFDITPNHVIGLNLSIPIFSSGLRQHKVQQARIGLEMARNQQELVSEQLMIQERQLRFNFDTAMENFQSQQANLRVARRVYESLNNKFSQGMISSLDLVTANSNYLQAENAYVGAMMQLFEARTELEKLMNAF